MNEFLEQFLLESREHVEQAVADLLALEQTPADRERLDSAFRAFHTLKGGAGIVDFDDMARAVHAAENVLSDARADARVVDTALVNDCLACLDQVTGWLNLIESSGELPKDVALQADALVSRFAAAAGSTPAQTQAAPAAEDRAWLAPLQARYPQLNEKARTAVRYRPAADCFFEGVDPLARVGAIPGLLAVEASPVAPWPALDQIDPFVCNLVFTVLSESDRAEVAAALGDALDFCDIGTLQAPAPTAASPVSELARQLIEAQIALLGEEGASGMAGRMAAAARVAVNVLRSSGNARQAGALEHTAAALLAREDAAALADAIGATFREDTATAETPAPMPGEYEAAARTLRIDAARIDDLVRLTGELTVVRNAIGHATRLAQEGVQAAAASLKQRHAMLDRLVGELQQAVLGMRVLPLRHVFQRFHRVLREISNELGKPVRLEVSGGETEADKAIVEMLFEPLLHVMRNAIDHGIEQADVRRSRGKPPTASILLSARREGDRVIVEVSDDGGGIDVERVRQTARRRGLFPDDVLAAMSEHEITNIIFQPGFSTTENVTSLSGRGVGMDAVRHAVGRLGGQVSVTSVAGKGATIRITLPFSVMMSRIMVVEAAGQSFGVPLDAVAETLRVKPGEITAIGNAQAVVLRNRTVPVIDLKQALNLPAQESAADEAVLVVTKINGEHNALRVDRIGERLEVMLKPLDGLLSGMPGITGSTLLGDGSVLLVLDLAELFL